MLCGVFLPQQQLIENRVGDYVEIEGFRCKSIPGGFALASRHHMLFVLAVFDRVKTKVDATRIRLREAKRAMYCLLKLAKIAPLTNGPRV